MFDHSFQIHIYTFKINALIKQKHKPMGYDD